jgi:hypothetical protein
MQLLLSSDLVRVPSEDTVLYTAKQYLQAQTQPADIATAKAALAPLIRAPQLSTFALCCAALAPGSSQHLLSSYAQQLQRLQLLKAVDLPKDRITEAAAVEGAPGSWGLGARQIRPLSFSHGVQLMWLVSVEQLKQACEDSFAKQEDVYIDSPQGSPPMGGVAWCMHIKCQQIEGGTVVELFAEPIPGDLPSGRYYRFMCTFTSQGVHSATAISPCLNSTRSWGFPNYFRLQPMSGSGWDEAAWAAAAAGMPTTGEMLLQLHMHSVCAT